MKQRAEIVQEQQATHYARDYDYRKGSPHLRHSHLNARLVGWINHTFAMLASGFRG